jgi:hypothetical protein
MRDDRTITRGERAIGFLGPQSSSATLAWLASHRGRLHSFILGGRRLSLWVGWDSKGSEYVDRSDDDVAAIYQLVYGEPMPRETPAAAPEQRP